MLGKDWSNLFWAGQNIQNLNESIEGIAQRRELDRIRNVRGYILEEVKEYLAKGDGREEYNKGKTLNNKS